MTTDTATGTAHAKAARADAAIRRMLPRCSDAMLSALRMRLIHAEQLRRLGVVPTGKPGQRVS
jgi:hypothetical protein